VRGEVVLGGEVRSFSGATVYVRLEDVSRADAAATVIAEQVLRRVVHRQGRRATLAFELHGPAPDEQATYAVRVHVDVDGDGRVSPGDYISVESHPVLTFGYPRQIEVRVREIPAGSS
jgi:uncharacterized lipoprotein YbaY